MAVIVLYSIIMKDKLRTFNLDPNILLALYLVYYAFTSESHICEARITTILQFKKPTVRDSKEFA